MATLFILFLTGLLAGTVDAIAGGGGLISLPVLLGLGVPPHLAFGTGKLQGIVGTFSAMWRYHSQQPIPFKKISLGLFCGLAGSMSGAIAAQVLSSDVLYQVIPVLLMVILTYSVFSPRLGVSDHPARMSTPLFYVIFGFALGFYDGFFGPGVGSIYVFCITFFLGYNLLKATAYTKVLNFNSSFVAAICFVIGGNVDYRMACCMAVGQLIGGSIGASLAISKGANLIRPVFLVIVLATTSTLVYKTYLNSVMLTHFTEQHGWMPPMLIAAVLVVTGGVVFYRRSAAKKM